MMRRPATVSVILSGVLAACLGLASSARAHDDGIVGQVQAGCTCHGATPTPSVTVSISGPTALPAHETGAFTIAVDGGPGNGGGFDARVVDGAGNQTGQLIVTDDANTQIEQGEITHTNPLLRAWNFLWQAPDTPGTYYVQAAGNSVNLNGAQTGDAWNFATPLAVVVGPCPEGATRPCGSSVGECRPGTQTCTGGVWGDCVGAIGPRPEVCNGKDDNCNGIIDDGCGGLLCPDGEITLSPGLLRAVRRRSGDDQVVSSRGTFVVPTGVTIAPSSAPVVFAVEADHRPVARVDLPAGSLVTSRDATLFTYRAGRSRLSLRQAREGFRFNANLGSLDLSVVDPAHPPLRMKQILKIGGDCFSSILVCSARDRSVHCSPERSVLLAGTVSGGGTPLSGVMLTAYDDSRLESVSVFSQDGGRFTFPRLRPGSYRLRARLVGWDDAWQTPLTLVRGRLTQASFALQPAADTNDQLPASAWFSLLLDKWPDPKIRADFTLSCGNCHQIAAYRFRRPKDEDVWRETLTRMMTFLPPYFQETRDQLIQNVLDTFGPNAPPAPTLPVPPAPSGDVLKAVIYEYGLGDANSRPDCHDFDLTADNRVISESARWIDPRTGERGAYPLVGDSHSIQRDVDGNMWITQAGNDQIAKLDLGLGTFTYYPLPKLGDDQGAYPHTNRFDAQGRLWMTLSKSNHLALFVPPTAQWTYYRLPPGDPAEIGLSIPVAYGCDVAPDQSVWWSQLFGERIGRYIPATNTMTAWRPPFYGPRRLHVDQAGITWVPGYASGVLGRFDPAIERWKVYPLPTGIPGPPGFGYSDTPYNLNANRRTGAVWINGSDSDTMIRYEPEHGQFTVYPLPSRASFTRDIEFDPDNNVWTCTSNEPSGPEEPGRGKFVKIELPPVTAVCGNGRVEPGEECDDGRLNGTPGHCDSNCTFPRCGNGVLDPGEQCDDGNTDNCDGCSSTCTIETGLRCGDGIVNAACGEQCDPPVPGRCDPQCQRIPYCGDGIVDPGEQCDDGALNGTPGHCDSNCTFPGCGNGILDPGEQCDDGNTVNCDGCSATCQTEVGWRCGDGIVDPACGEQCDPPSAGPPECSYRCQLGAPPPLGTRHFSFGGALYSSALGTGVPLGSPTGAFDLVAGTPGIDGVAPVTVAGPIYYQVPLLGGSFGYICVRITSCTGIVDCKGGTPVGVQAVQDSAGPGKQGHSVVITTGLGGPGGPGAAMLTCSQSLIQLSPPAPDCTTVAYPPDGTTVYTTGESQGSFLNADVRVGTGMIDVTGQNFSCPAWTVEEGPGELGGVFLIEADPNAGDTANVCLLAD
jgi:cysteine-rich repeat protein